MTAANFSALPSWVINFPKLKDLLYNDSIDLTQVSSCVEASYITSLTSSIRTFRTWNKKLAPTMNETSAIFAFIGKEGLVVPNILTWCKELKQHTDMSKLNSVFYTSNACFNGLDFKSKDSVVQVVQSFQKLGECIAMPIVKTLDNTQKFKLLWLPPNFPDHFVENLLSSFGENNKFEHEKVQTDDNVFTITNTIKGQFTLKKGYRIEKLPNLINLPPPYKGCALLVIVGRPYFCLKCRKQGHRRKECPLQHCHKCNTTHTKNDPCSTLSYARVARKGIPFPVAWAEDIYNNEEDLSDNGIDDLSDTEINYLTEKSNLNKTKATQRPEFKPSKHTDAHLTGVKTSTQSLTKGNEDTVSGFKRKLPICELSDNALFQEDKTTESMDFSTDSEMEKQGFYCEASEEKSESSGKEDHELENKSVNQESKTETPSARNYNKKNKTKSPPGNSGDGTENGMYKETANRGPRTRSSNLS